MLFRIGAPNFHQRFFDFITSCKISETSRKAEVGYQGWMKNKASMLHLFLDFVDILRN